MARPLLPTGPEPDFESRVEEIVRRLMRREAAQLIGPANANEGAQDTGGGIGIQNVRRGVGRAVLTGLGSNITVSATSYAPLSTPLKLDMSLSGRPLKVTIAGNIASGSGGGIFLDVTLRGVRVSGVTNGLASCDSITGETVCGVDVVPAPPAGPATLEVVAFRFSSDGLVLADASNRFVLLAEEL